MAVEKKSVPMREQSAQQRIKNFDEVPLGYNEEEALAEASRCMQCAKKPCVEGCPVNVDIPGFIKALRNKEYQKAIDIIHETDSLPCMTGRVCPQEEQCQAFCIIKKMNGDPISIGRLERFLADLDLENRKKSKSRHAAEVNKNGKKIAVVGSGPAGLTCAAELAKKGYDVSVFEGYHKLGGVLVYGIPEFRLPKAIVESEVDMLKDIGVRFVTNALIGRAMTIEDLFKEGYKAIFIGAGAGLPNFMGIPGENLNGVYSANEFLTRVNLMKAYKFPEYHTPVKKGINVAVVGGGNVAMDSARTAIRLGAKHVYLIYRRSEKEMPARIEEVERAKEEGVDFRLLTNPVRYIADENSFVKQVECIKMELGEPDASGRRSPVPMAGSEFKLDVDEVIVAIGNTPNPIIPRTTPGLKIKKRGEIEADDWGATNIAGVYAGGDIVTGAATVITAMGAGRKSAEAIDRFLAEGK